MIGIALSLGASLCFACSAITAKLGLERADTLLGTAINVFVSTALAFTLLLTVDRIDSLLEFDSTAFEWFAAAGAIHFFFGWAFRNASIRRIGAARAQTLAGTNPLIAGVLAVLFLQEDLGTTRLIGIALIVLGSYFVGERPSSAGIHNLSVNPRRTAWLGYGYGFLTAACFGFSPLLIKLGYRTLDAPIWGLASGLSFASLLFLLDLGIRNRWKTLRTLDHRSLLYLITTGTLVGLGTIAKWVALQAFPVVLVVPLTQTAPLIAILLSTLLLRGSDRAEGITLKVWLGGFCVVIGGSLVALGK